MRHEQTESPGPASDKGMRWTQPEVISRTNCARKTGTGKRVQQARQLLGPSPRVCRPFSQSSRALCQFCARHAVVTAGLSPGVSAGSGGRGLEGASEQRSAMDAAPMMLDAMMR